MRFLARSGDLSFFRHRVLTSRSPLFYDTVAFPFGKDLPATACSFLVARAAFLLLSATHFLIVLREFAARTRRIS